MKIRFLLNNFGDVEKRPFRSVVLNLFASTYHLESFLYITYHKVPEKINYFDFFLNFRRKTHMFSRKKKKVFAENLAYLKNTI